MKKILSVATVALMAVFSVQAQEATTDNEIGNLGIGYQGMIVGNLLNGVAVRSAPAPFGWQAEIVQGIIDAEGTDVDIMVIKGKAYYALIERANSTFYTGASVGYWKLGLEDLYGSDVHGFSIAPLIGVEWNFAELPELGFNFEVSYELNQFDVESEGIDAEIFGVNVCTGMTYYF